MDQTKPNHGKCRGATSAWLFSAEGMAQDSTHSQHATGHLSVTHLQFTQKCCLRSILVLPSHPIQSDTFLKSVPAKILYAFFCPLSQRNYHFIAAPCTLLSHWFARTVRLLFTHYLPHTHSFHTITWYRKLSQWLAIKYTDIPNDFASYRLQHNPTTADDIQHDKEKEGWQSEAWHSRKAQI